MSRQLKQWRIALACVFVPLSPQVPVAPQSCFAALLQHMEPEEAAAHVAAAEAAVRAVKLDVIERLLWATDFGTGAVDGKPSLPPGDSWLELHPRLAQSSSQLFRSRLHTQESVIQSIHETNPFRSGAVNLVVHSVGFRYVQWAN